MKYGRLYIIAILLLLALASTGYSQSMEDYCQWPPFLTTAAPPNVMLVIDVSGSMGWDAYSFNDWDWNGDGILDGYDPNTTYEGYFDPEKYYTLDANGVYVETTPTGQPCQRTCLQSRCRRWPLGDCDWDPGTCSWRRPWRCCTQWQQSGDCNLQSGNYLNYLYMSRIDLVRWALTGGKPDSCDTKQIQSCDPELYPQSNQLSCDAEGCVLETSSGVKVKARWDRITGSHGGLLFQLKKLPVQPRMGVFLYGGSQIVDAVYIGDFTASANFDAVNPYKNTITAINSRPPSSTTPTAPALWDVYNYFAQNAPEYGGLQPQTGAGNEWKNPLYQCIDENNDNNCQGNEFVLIPCAKNFVILLTDGQWNYGGGPPATSTCTIDTGFEAHSADPVVPAYWLHKKGFTNTPTGLQSYIESVYTVGLWLGGTGELSLKNVAMYGSFDRSKDWPDGLTGYPDDTCSMDDCGSGKGSGCEPLPPSSPDWDKDGDGLPDTFFTAKSAIEIKNKMVDIILDILKRVYSGTAVSILASGEGQGANLLQAVFYPKRSLGLTQAEIDWTGVIQNLWYHIEPYEHLSTIREDTVKDYHLYLNQDWITSIYFDENEQKAMAAICPDSDGDGDCDGAPTVKDFEELKNLWEAGIKLFQRDPSTRTIYTNINDDSALDPFVTASASSLKTFLNAADLTEAERIIRYVRGEDIKVCSVTQTTECSTDADCPAGEKCIPLYRERTATLYINNTNVTNTWKLGDIVHSTPKIQSWVPLNDYYERYDDVSYYRFTRDLTEDDEPKATKIYTDRGMVYVGANDGMLHAFYLGKLKQINDRNQPFLKAILYDTSTQYDPGDEVWAFIPKNVLPYLRYLTEKDYCHLYYVDASPFIFDASIGTTGCTETNYWDCKKTTDTWRTILIGSMNLGGACRDISSTCTDCVKTPVSGLGYSSYFALDITDPYNPNLLWEFAHPELGFSSTGPIVFKLGPDPTKNGRWFVLFASGPTGTIETTTRQFLGVSDQNLKLFILDLKTGQMVTSQPIDTGIPYAFGGGLYYTVLDLDASDKEQYTPDYQDDVIYIPYVKQVQGTGNTVSWTGGGILRMVIKDFTPDAIPTTSSASDWNVSKLIEFNSGPVVSSPRFIRFTDEGQLWLFFGTGRYFYKDDDVNGRRRLYGIKEPCYDSTIHNINLSKEGCGMVLESNLCNADDPNCDPTSDQKQGWYIELDCAYTDTCTNKSPAGYGAERLITHPVAVQELKTVFFTTMAPTAEVCGYGGNTYIWAVDYKTGGKSSADLKGRALVQLSTGEIKSVDLSEAFTERGGRRTVAFKGFPPLGEGLLIERAAEPLDEFLFIKEK